MALYRNVLSVNRSLIATKCMNSKNHEIKLSGLDCQVFFAYIFHCV